MAKRSGRILVTSQPHTKGSYACGEQSIPYRIVESPWGRPETNVTLWVHDASIKNTRPLGHGRHSKCLSFLFQSWWPPDTALIALRKSCSCQVKIFLLQLLLDHQARNLGNGGCLHPWARCLSSIDCPLSLRLKVWPEEHVLAITRELVGNADSWALPRAYAIRVNFSTTSPGDEHRQVRETLSPLMCLWPCFSSSCSRSFRPF